MVVIGYGFGPSTHGTKYAKRNFVVMESCAVFGRVKNVSETN